MLNCDRDELDLIAEAVESKHTASAHSLKPWRHDPLATPIDVPLVVVDCEMHSFIERSGGVLFWGRRNGRQRKRVLGDAAALGVNSIG